MRLLPKDFDTFNPVVTLMGVLFALAGLGYGLALFRHAFQHPVVLVVAAIPTILGVIGVIIVIRQVQVFRSR